MLLQAVDAAVVYSQSGHFHVIQGLNTPQHGTQGLHLCKVGSECAGMALCLVICGCLAQRPASMQQHAAQGRHAGVAGRTQARSWHPWRRSWTRSWRRCTTRLRPRGRSATRRAPERSQAKPPRTPALRGTGQRVFAFFAVLRAECGGWRALCWAQPGHKAGSERASVCEAAPKRSAARQANVLAWLEGVCGNADAAAALLNSALGPLLVRLLAAALAPGLRARLASVLGLLVRHTAFIGPELAACGDAQLSTPPGCHAGQQVPYRECLLPPALPVTKSERDQALPDPGCCCMSGRHLTKQYGNVPFKGSPQHARMCPHTLSLGQHASASIHCSA